MKSNLLTITLSVLFLIGSAMMAPHSDKIALGDNLPHEKVKMEDISGKKYSLNNLKKENGLLVVFAANKCVAIKYWGDRLMEAAEYCNDHEIGLVWVNANQTQRSDGESFEDMKKFAIEKNITFPYVVDEDFLLANTFGVEVTPTSYLFDNKGKLVFQGMVDDNMMDASSTKEKYLMDALASMTNNQVVTVPEKFGRGCRIPRE